MLSLSQKGKMFLLRILGVVGTCSSRNIENEKENVSVMKYIAVFFRAYFSPFIALNIKTTPLFPPPMSRALRWSEKVPSAER